LLEQQALVPMFGDRPVELGLKGQESVLDDRIDLTQLDAAVGRHPASETGNEG